KIEEFINKILNNNHHTSFPVVSDGRLHGFLLLSELKAIPSERWPALEARQVMRPVDNSMFVNSTATIAQARQGLTAGQHQRARCGARPKWLHRRLRKPSRASVRKWVVSSRQ